MPSTARGGSSLPSRCVLQRTRNRRSRLLALQLPALTQQPPPRPTRSRHGPTGEALVDRQGLDGTVAHAVATAVPHALRSVRSTMRAAGAPPAPSARVLPPSRPAPSPRAPSVVSDDAGVPGGAPPVHASEQLAPADAPLVPAAVSAQPTGVVHGSRTPLAVTPLSLPPRTIPSPGNVQQRTTDVRFKDVLGMLDTFRGTDNATDTVVDDGSFISFHEWLRNSLCTLRSTRQPPSTYVTALCHKLAGPARTEFFELCERDSVDFETLSPAQFEAQFSQLYHHAAAKYTQLAHDMHFDASRTQHGVQTWRSYVMHSSWRRNLDNNEFLCDLLREKLNDAYPNCLLIAQSEYQLSLDPRATFTAYTDTALRIAARMQLRKRGPGTFPRPAPATPRKTPRGAAPHSMHATPPTSLDDIALCRRYDRCFHCALPLHSHDRDRGSPGSKAKRLAALRAAIARGDDPPGVTRDLPTPHAPAP